MSKSAILSSSIAKKYWMAVTGLFLCLFLVGHLLGNLQLVLKTGEEGRRAFNEYAYFMTHNIFIKVLSYATYISILFHAVDGLMLALQNRKARPVKYAYNNPSANSSSAARQMAVLGTAILVFIVIHMANFWWKMKVTEEVPLYTKTKEIVEEGQNPMTGEITKQSVKVNFALTTKGEYMPYSYIDPQTNLEIKVVDIKNNTIFIDKNSGLQRAEGYKDLHKIVMAFFGKSIDGAKTNENALLAVILYVLSMAVLSFHLMHGFASAFQSLGINHRRYTPLIKLTGKAFAIIVPAAFAIIPILIYFP
jgi:succinate dehydrogenase / fumarate reductase cytochrome b subunit